MILNPILAGGKWKFICNPSGITHSLETSSDLSIETVTFSGLTKANLKKGCLLAVLDHSSYNCLLYIHEDGKIEMSTNNSAKYSLIGPTTVTSGTTGVTNKNYQGGTHVVIIGLA